MCKRPGAYLAGALKFYEESLAIRERLAKSDHGHAGWQRDLSVSHERIGDVQLAQGDLARALISYEDSLAIREPLVKSNPGNAEWQHDLAGSLGKLASVYRQSGDKAKALGIFRQGQAIMARLTKLSPDNAEWKQDLADFDQEIAELAERQDLSQTPTRNRSPHPEEAPKAPSRRTRAPPG